MKGRAVGLQGFGGFGVKGLGFSLGISSSWVGVLGIQGLGVAGFGVRVCFGVWDPGLGVQGSGFWFLELGLGIFGIRGFRVLDMDSSLN